MTGLCPRFPCKDEQQQYSNTLSCHLGVIQVFLEEMDAKCNKNSIVLYPVAMVWPLILTTPTIPKY